jgi:hypothetical protein
VNIALERLFEGMIATLRSDVIPQVGDPYARGQAVGLIDLINNIAPRVEWARGPLLKSVVEKRRVLRLVAEAMGEPLVEEASAPEASGSSELEQEQARLDARICDAMQAAHKRSDEAGKQALGLLIRHARDEATERMKITRKPLFAEIAGGAKDNQVPAQGPAA